MISSTSRVLTASLLLASLALPSLARAQARKPTVPAPAADDARTAARRQGDEAMKELRYGDALAAYRAAHEQSPDPVLLYNMARACQSLERFPEAVDYAEQFRAQAPPEVLARVPGLDGLITQLRARVSTLDLQAEPAGARVMLRGREIARTPVKGPLRVNAGAGRLEVLLEGYAPFERDLQLDPGSSVEVQVKLVAREVAAPKPGTLVIRSRPLGASVSLDGAPVGLSPVEASAAPGPHRIDLSRAGHEPLSTQVQLASGARQEIDLTLTPTHSSLLSRWWFWTGVGVVVAAGGTALVYALTTERDPKSGTIAPGQLNNALVRF